MKIPSKKRVDEWKVCIWQPTTILIQFGPLFRMGTAKIGLANSTSIAITIANLKNVWHINKDFSMRNNLGNLFKFSYGRNFLGQNFTRIDYIYIYNRDSNQWPWIRLPWKPLLVTGTHGNYITHRTKIKNKPNIP